MTLAPIRGAPPGAPIPAFPIGEPKAQPRQPTTVTTFDDQPQAHPQRQRQTPIEIVGNGTILTFRVIPEIPAIMRASMTIHVTATSGEPSSSQALGFLRMSAQSAKDFLTDLGKGRSPIVATGDEDGTVRIEFEITGSGPAISIYQSGQRDALRRLTIDGTFDLAFVANEILADFGE